MLLKSSSVPTSVMLSVINMVLFTSKLPSEAKYDICKIACSRFRMANFDLLYKVFPIQYTMAMESFLWGYLCLVQPYYVEKRTSYYFTDGPSISHTKCWTELRPISRTTWHDQFWTAWYLLYPGPGSHDVIRNNPWSLTVLLELYPVIGNNDWLHQN